MVSTLNFLTRLKEQGVELWLDQNQIRFRARAGAMTPEVKEELRSRKQEIIQLLKATAKVQISSRGNIPRALPNDPDHLSFAQEGLMLMERLSPGNILFHIPMAFHLVGPLDIEVTCKALRSMVRRHASLRTCFKPDDKGQQHLDIQEHVALPISVLDLSGHAPSCRLEMARELVGEQARVPFDLAVAPLIRAYILRLAENEHVLAMNVHHLVFDGWSMGILISEWSSLYSAYLWSRPSPLPPLRVTYRDYACHQRKLLTETRLAAQVNWWKEQLGGLEPIALPGDRPRPPRITHKGANVHFVLPESTREVLENFSEETSTSLFTVITAALMALVHRYTGAKDICLGAAMSNRSHVEVEGVIGLFVNLVALRVQADDRPGFATFLERVKTATLDAFRHQDVPFERVVQETRQGTPEGMHPLFNMQVVMANDLLHDAQPMGVFLAPFHWGSGVVSRKDLTLLMGTSGNHLMGDIEYNTDIFDESTIQRLVHHLTILLREACLEPDMPLDTLSMLSEREKAALVLWNDTRTAYPRIHAIGRIFEITSRQFPDNTALLASAGPLTYAELNARANRIARLLRYKGVKAGDFIGFCLEQSPNRVATMLAIAKLGAAFVPLDPRYPESRVTYMIEDTQARLLVTESARAQILPRTNAEMMILDREKALKVEAADNIGLTVPADAPAYIMYTSGSTGTPKGVVVPHRGIVRLVKGNPALDIKRDDVFLQSASVAFDAATLELWAPLLNGARLVLMASHASDELPKMVQDHKVTVLWLTAQLFHLMVDRHLDCFASVRQVLAGGEALSPIHVQSFLKAWPKARLLNGYGPTENTTFTCCGPLHETGLSPFCAPIGQPIANTSVHIVDRYIAEMPLGYGGELVTGGDGLAQGYLNRPALTAEKFIPNPFARKPGARLYRTGDLARHSATEHTSKSVILYMGRMDRQVKIRGYRIEPGEIERVLEGHELISGAHVLLNETAVGEKALVAYICLLSDGSAERQKARRALKTYLTDNLPTFMVPAAFVFLEEFPRTTNGKLDKAALPEPDWDEREEDNFQQPATPCEELLAVIWSELLLLDTVSREDNFFDLGGHSLAANRLMGEMSETFGVDLPVRTVFEHPTLTDLAAQVELARGESAEHVPMDIERLPRTEQALSSGFALSFAQERLWFLDRLEPGSAMYSVPVAVRMSGALFKDTLRSCFNEIVRRHEALRTRFMTADGLPRQIIDPHLEIPFSVVDLRNFPEGKREEEAMRRMTEVAHVPFNLERGPLLRLVLYQLDDQTHLMLMNMHHIVSDGWSLKIMFDEVGLLYEAYTRGKGSPLPPLPIQYVDYAAWQRLWLTGPIREAQYNYWREQLAGAPGVLEIPLDFTRPKVQTFRGSGVRFIFSDEETIRFRTMTRSHGVTPFMALCAAYATLLMRYSSQWDICVGTPIANRGHGHLQKLIGFFLNTLVLRFQANACTTFSELLAQTRSLALDAYAHQELPFEQLVARLQPERDMSRPPLFQAAFSWDSETSDTEVRLPGLVLKHQTIDYRIAKFDLSLGMGFYRDNLYGSIGYNQDLFRHITIDRMSKHFGNLLRAFTENTNCSLGHVDILDAEERQNLIEGFNQTDATLGITSVRTAFEITSRIHGERPALIQDGELVTYDQLNRRTNKVAHYLTELGVGPGTIVAVMCEPSKEMVQGQLAALKVGACFLPLDPSYPKDRLAYMLEDSAVRIILTQSYLITKLPRHEGRLVLLDDHSPDQAALEGKPGTNPKVIDFGQAPAYMIYTSGSTGKPKGVVVSNLGLANLSTWHQQAFQVTCDDRATKLAHVAFDASIWEIMPYLTVGASIVIGNSQILREPETLRDWLIEQRITICFLPTPVTEEILGLDWLGPCDLRFMLTGGDHLHHYPADSLPFTLVNNYGPTENSVVTTSAPILNTDVSRRTPPIGMPIQNTRIYVLDQHMNATPPGVPGQLYIAGRGLAHGYHGRFSLTAESFVPNPFAFEEGREHTSHGSRLYASGDLVRLLRDDDGHMVNLEFLGRIGNQVKLRGFRIELGEVEHHLCEFPGVTDAVALVITLDSGEKKLVGYVQVPDKGEGGVDISALREFISDKLPYYMVPSVFVVVERFPKTPNGKVDRRNLASARHLSSDLQKRYVPPKSGLEQALTRIWGEVLGLERVGAQTNFFDLGGHSLLLARVQSKMEQTLHLKPDMVELFQYPTIRTLVSHLLKREHRVELKEEAHQARARKTRRHFDEDAVAIVGFAGRFPGAQDITGFWEKLCEGTECIVDYPPVVMRAAGVPQEMLEHPNYVRRGTYVEDIDRFDHEFFGITPKEAALTDPQHRLFLQACWQAIEHAGYAVDTPNLLIGLYAGAGFNGYLHNNIMPNQALIQSEGGLQSLLGNDAGFLSTRVSYRLNLKGPSVNVQTACSTSLVAAHMACQGLLGGDCDIALAGGVALSVPQETGYLYQEGLTLSPDGRCRAFDAAANGTVRGSGLGVVVLKRAGEARTARDTIYAVIKGSAINNDGSAKAGFTAPSVDGQTTVIRDSLAVAGFSADSVGYVEAHGTGTALGDPIEMQALCNAYRAEGATQPRMLGSLKPNIGHLDAAAGVAGLLKTTLSLYHQTLVPSIHYQNPNPRMKPDSLFQVVTRKQPFKPMDGAPLRAAVSSFGIGGTNVHMVLERVGSEPDSDAPPSRVLLPVSARCESSLNDYLSNLHGHLSTHRKQNLADVAYTLATGRVAMPYRACLVCADQENAVDLLSRPTEVVCAESSDSPPDIAFLFPGQGSQYVGMARQLYHQDRGFREDLARCAEILSRESETRDALDLLDLLYPENLRHEEAETRLALTAHTQPALFSICWAMGRWWMRRGVYPKAMIGHSLGEYVAATLADVFSLQDALALVAARGRLMGRTPGGAMLAVAASESRVSNLLHDKLQLAAINGPERCVLSGDHDAIGAVTVRLQELGLRFRRLKTSGAFHSHCMDPCLEDFHDLVRSCRLGPPAIPFVSNLTGDWIREEQATDPTYWVDLLRQPVRFADGVARIHEEGPHLFLEVGPGRTLSQLVMRIANVPSGQILSSLPNSGVEDDLEIALESLGHLWLAGENIQWAAHFEGRKQCRIPLPTYPFRRHRHWIHPPVQEAPEKAPLSRILSALDQMGALNQRVDVVELQRVLGADHGNGIQEPSPQPEPMLEPVTAETNAQKSPVETSIWWVKLARIWHDCLGTHQPAADDHFFDLGGDSLALAAVRARLLEYHQIEVPMTVLFDHPQFGRMVSWLEGQVSSQTLQEVPPPEVTRFPLSSAQQALWFFERMEPGTAGYSLPTAIQLNGPLSTLWLQEVLLCVLSRHGALRTIFFTQDEQVYQDVRPVSGFSLKVVDYSALALEHAWQKAREHVDREARRPFCDLGLPLVRLQLLRTTPHDHILFFNVHHLIFDGWSLKVFCAELSQFYRQMRRGQKLNRQRAYNYGHFVKHESSVEVEPKRMERVIHYLEAYDQSLRLPMDIPAEEQGVFPGGTHTFPIPAAICERTFVRCKELGVTPFALLLGVYAQLLLRYTWSDSLAVGCPVANRTTLAQEGAIGYFTNVVVMGFDRKPSPDVATYIQNVGRMVVEVLSLADIPLGKTLEASSRNVHGKAPLVQILFSLENASGADQAQTLLDGCEACFLPLETGAATFALDLAILQQGQQLVARLQWRTDMFSHETISRFQKGFLQLLEGMVSHMELAPEKLSLLSGEERARLLAQIQTPDTWTSSLHHLASPKDPNAIALIYDQQVMTFVEVDARANQIAHFLHQRRFRGQVIATLLNREPDLITTVLGILRAGCIWLPLDPAMPLERHKLLMADAKPAMIISKSEQAQILANDNLLLLDEDALMLTMMPKEPPSLTVAGEEGAYIIYTSGTTGKPKGTCISHDALSHLAWSMAECYQLAPSDRVLQMCSPGFDVFLEEVFPTYHVGATLVQLPSDWDKTASSILHCMTIGEVTVANLPTALWHNICDGLTEGLAIPTCLHTLIVGTEAAQRKSLETWKMRAPEVRWVNAYGTTETTVTSACWKLGSGPVPGDGAVPIGVPIGATRLYIFDAAGYLQNPGAAGELYIEGPGLANGYWQRPALTAERFVPHPYATSPGQRLYRSGDRMRRLEDGTHLFLGRMDRQLKVRGFRVEPAEIERVMSAHPAVSLAVIQPRTCHDSLVLDAYISTGPGKEVPSLAEMTVFVEKSLPHYMVPSSLTVMNQWPRTLSGKVDRRALPAPMTQELGRCSREPQGPTEAKVLALWRDLLSYRELCPDDDLFTAGAHSLILAKAIRRISKEFGVDLPFKTLFEQRTCAELADYIDALRWLQQGPDFENAEETFL